MVAIARRRSGPVGRQRDVLRGSGHALAILPAGARVGRRSANAVSHEARAAPNFRTPPRPSPALLAPRRAPLPRACEFSWAMPPCAVIEARPAPSMNAAATHPPARPRVAVNLTIRRDPLSRFPARPSLAFCTFRAPLGSMEGNTRALYGSLRIARDSTCTQHVRPARLLRELIL
ncbi:hypothetical protein EVAR_87643_1 [Eumeta japonica]|uniref:Uncharacterized protein n=1 Tax=Eumeta variegata TaxID=151549 RepID=A0A4C1WHZ8_EUMVA|nr:hypothetical protein EVAR_87643_1 [Eumeta japonica]